jgi:hypothetical protein
MRPASLHDVGPQLLFEAGHADLLNSSRHLAEQK